VSKKKKGMFSWLGFGQDKKEQVTEDSSQAVDENTVEPELAIESKLNDGFVDTVVTTEPITTEPITTEPITTDAEEIELEAELSTQIEQPEEQEAPKAEIEEQPAPEVNDPAPEINQPTKLGFFARLKQGLSKTRKNLGGGLFDLFRGKQIDDELFEELETHLLLADVGVETTMKIIDSLTKSASRKQLKDAEALYDLLKVELKKIIENVNQPLEIPESDVPFVMLMVGVNGVGKTTTIGKLAKQFQAEGKSVMLAAGDTFRAAAVEQLQVWGDRNDIPVIAQHTGADSASVIFDAISAAKARKIDILIADTAGRLQNKAHLMEELKKVVRVMKKLDVNAPHEVMLTLDAGTGQNALSQTKLFDEAVGLTGLTLTKLDGTAKGGVVFAVADKHSIPIRYLGVGEGIDDLRPFNSDDFIDALFTKE
jgi:fused signal recognition particle receptor